MPIPELDWNNVSEVKPSNGTPSVQTVKLDWNHVSEVKPEPKPQEKKPSLLGDMATEGISSLGARFASPENKGKGDGASPVSKFFRFMTRDNPEERLNTSEWNMKNNMAPKEGESEADFTKRYSTAFQEREKGIEKEGLGRNIQSLMTPAMIEMAGKNPAMLIRQAAGFSIKDHFFNARRFLDAHFPEVSPTVKDVAEGIDMIMTGGLIEGVPAAYKKGVFLKSLNDLKLPSSVNVHANRFLDLMTDPQFTAAERKDVMATLGVTDSHIKNADEGKLPINIGSDKFMDLSQKPYWDKVKVTLGMGKYVRNSAIDMKMGKDDKATSEDIRKEFSGVKNEQTVRGNQLAEELGKEVRAKPKEEQPSGKLTIQYGKREYPIDSIKNASSKWNDLRDMAMREGVSSKEADTPLIKDASGKTVGYISWNGEVWKGDPGVGERVKYEEPVAGEKKVSKKGEVKDSLDKKKEVEISFKGVVEKNQDIAKNLKGYLLLVTGDLDDNVHPGNTLRVVDALIKANKRFDFMMLPGQKHAYGNDTPYFDRLMWYYFAEHLLGDYRTNVDLLDF